VKIVPVLTFLLFSMLSAAQSKPDESAIRNILQEEVTAWNNGDAETYSRRFADTGTFTNILGMFFTGHKAFLDRHQEIFKGMFQGTVLQQEIASIQFIHSDVAIVETITWVSGFPKSGPPPGTHVDSKGRLRTRLLQVMEKHGQQWKIQTYHNVDIKPQVTAPEPH
jgi:uncharacterized protein (TIGR02246 family)